jgi:hypothetical protein
MSEFQSYEFVSLDRPLSEKEMSELRGISTRAEISPTRFWNEYQWGDLKADPAALRTWVKALPPGDKDRWLAKAVNQPDHPIGADLIATFHRQTPSRPKEGRTVSELLTRAEEIRTEREEE